MKILWYANTPCGAIFKLASNLVVGGWLTSLENELVKHEDIDLHIAFYWHKKLKPFKFNNTTYYPVLPQANSETVFTKVFKRVFNVQSDFKQDLIKFKDIYNSVNPDLIHIHGTEHSFGLIQRFCKIPTVISIQGILSSYVEMYYSGLTRNDIFKYNSLKNKLRLRSPIYRYNEMKHAAKREKEIFSLSLNILGRTLWDKRISKLLAPNSTYFIGEEILRESFYTNSWNKESFGSPIIISTTMSGGLYKGLEMIVKTAALLTLHSEINFIWNVIGIEEKSDFAYLVKKFLNVNYTRLPIRFFGKLEEELLVKTLLQSDLFCQVSHIENSPNSLCEAMILGMPIICSYAGGSDSLIENNKEGLMYQSGDPYSLSGTILDLSQNFNQAKKLGEEARSRALKRHDKAKIALSYLNLYKKLTIK